MEPLLKFRILTLLDIHIGTCTACLKGKYLKLNSIVLGIDKMIEKILLIRGIYKDVYYSTKLYLGSLVSPIFFAGLPIMME